jgi:hypothetical protein
MEPLHPGDAPSLGARSRSVRDRVEDEPKLKVATLVMFHAPGYS